MSVSIILPQIAFNGYCKRVDVYSRYSNWTVQFKPGSTTPILHPDTIRKMLGKVNDSDVSLMYSADSDKEQDVVSYDTNNNVLRVNNYKITKYFSFK